MYVLKCHQTTLILKKSLNCRMGQAPSYHLPCSVVTLPHLVLPLVGNPGSASHIKHYPPRKQGKGIILCLILSILIYVHEV